MLDGVLNSLLQLLLDLVESTNVVPGHVGNLYDGLSESRRVGSSEGEPEVVHGYTKRIQHLRVDSIPANKLSISRLLEPYMFEFNSLVKVDKIHLLTNLLHSSFRTEGSHIGTDVTVSVSGNLLEIDVVAELHVLGVNSQNLESSSWVRDTDVDFTVKSTESSKGRVNGVGLKSVLKLAAGSV
jgi:hypothetical protein